MATNNLLTQAAPDYRKFVDNQVLTDDQLNAALDHLDYQDQLARVLLSGVGIVCGLNVSKVQDKDGKPAVHLSKGAAITTAGNLLKCDARNFKGFKEFNDGEVQYPRFTDIEGQTLPLWELETNLDPSDVYSLDQFETTTDITLDEAVTVLYLENYLHDREECSPIDCDTQGREVIKNIRVLLIKPGYAAALTFGDTIFSQRMKSDDHSFPEGSHLYTPRVVLNEAKAANYEAFKKAYRVSFNDIAARIKELGSLQVFTDLKEKFGIDPVEELENFSVSHTNIQYLYDFYKDLVTACNELNDLLKKNFAICCPNPEAFPKHVLLGQLSNEESKWRHGFYPSPTHNQQNSIATMQAAFKRILLMIEHFNPTPKDEIIITPSRGSDVRIGERAVPFYYDLEEAEKAHAFLENWRSDGDEVVLNYYGSDYPGQNFDPLDVCLEDHNFYRIEGHVGDHVMDAHLNIHEIQKEKGLAFDIKPVAIGNYADSATIDYDKHRVYFEDLQVVLQAWNEEQQCMVQEATQFLSGFSTKTQGKHVGYAPISDDGNESGDNDFDSTPLLMEPEYTVVTIFPEKETPRKQAPKNTVVESISQNKNTWGYLAAKNKALRSFSNRNDIQMNVAAVVSGIVLDWDNDIKAAAIDIPARLIGYMKETEDYKLTDIGDFTEENLQKYIKALEAQCQQIHQAKKQFQYLIPALKNKDNEYVKPWIKQYEYILNRIASSCCIIKKVKVLFENIMERKKKLLQELVLHKFMDEHPGAEHKAGVERGGTFVLLYYSKNKKPVQNNLIYSRAIPLQIAKGTAFVQQKYYGSTSENVSRPKADPQSSKPLNVTPQQPELKISDLSERLSTENISPERIGRIPGLEVGRLPSDLYGNITPVENIPHGTVIGDLCLPYICCSDVPPTKFVFPEQLAELRLPTDHICMDEKDGADSIPLNVKPAEGDVKAFIQKRELSGVISVNQSGSYFVPNKVSKEDYRKPIRFEVNGQPVDPVLTLYLKPRPNFSVENIEYFKNNTVAGVTFKNTSTPFNELTFEWDFDGEVKQQEGVKEFNHTFQVKPGENNEFEVRLTASNGPCKATHTQTVKMNLEKPDEDCETTYLKEIKDSRDFLESTLNEYPEAMGWAADLYKDTIEPKYKKLIGDVAAAFNGDDDTEIFQFIRTTQKSLEQTFSDSENQIPQVVILKVYYELILLYFYLQACRVGSIEDTPSMSLNDLSKWPTFTARTKDDFPNALKTMLEQDDILGKLKNIRDNLGKRFNDLISDIVDELIRMLGEVSG